MNALTRAGVLVEDKLFATLDPTIRALRLPNGDKVMIVDTVGFINKIPHSLIEAFKSTLEEVKSADLLLHLVDMASPLFEEQIEVVEDVLQEIGAGDVPSILVPNKIDIASTAAIQHLKSRAVEGVCPISALTGAGLEPLLDLIGRVLDQGKEPFRASFFSWQGKLLALLRERGRILTETYHDDEIRVTALVTPKLAGQMRKLMSAGPRRDQSPP
jgi:GTP-binding protein HflX